MNTITNSSFRHFALLTIVSAIGVSLAACSRQDPGTPPVEQVSPEKESMEGTPMPESTPVQPSASEANTTQGTVKSVDQKARKVTIAHAAVPSLNWPAMTMTFKVQDEATVSKLKEGDEVEFSFTQGAGNEYVIDSISPRK
jgi:Cu(I)/Ag(I) efflux system periplasmic protein CusF